MDDDDLDIGLDVALFGEERVNHGGPAAPPVVWSCDDYPPISVAVSDAPSTALMAHHVWQSSMTLSSVLARKRLEHVGVKIDSESTVVELGAGAALPSLVSSLILNAKKVVATDYPDPNVVLAMEKNAARNNCSANLKVMGYGWGEDPQPILKEVGGHIDVILAADTLWIAQYHDILLESLKRLMDERTFLVLAFMHHDHDGSTAGRFLQKLSESSFKLVHEETRDWRTSSGERSRLEYGDVLIKVFRKA